MLRELQETKKERLEKGGSVVDLETKIGQLSLEYVDYYYIIAFNCIIID